MTYHIRLRPSHFSWPDLKTLMARATPLRSGDVLAGIAAATMQERVAAQLCLTEVPLARFLKEHLIPPETDEVTRLILETHNKGVEVIGISLDNDKKPLTDYIATRKMPGAQISDRPLGKESNAAHYKVQAIPFCLLIGKDGKISAVNPRGEKLEPAITEALAK